MSDWIEVANINDLAIGSMKKCDINGQAIVLINLDGEFYAIEDRCSHDSGILSNGDIEGDQIICPRHGAAFCIKTGEVMCPPAYEDILTFPVRVVGDVVQVKL